MSTRCYGSTWFGLTKADAVDVVKWGLYLSTMLEHVYDETYAWEGEDHSASHSLFHPDEEYIPYILYGVMKKQWPPDFTCTREMRQTHTAGCAKCEYRFGHAAALDAGQERDMRLRAKKSGALFMRKVSAITSHRQTRNGLM